CVRQCLTLQISGNPGTLGASQEDVHAWFVGPEGAVIQVGRVVKVASLPCGIQLHVEHLLGNRPAITVLQHTRVLDGVLQIKNHPQLGSGIAFVYQYRASPQKFPVALERQVKRSIEQRVPWTDERGEWLALRCD